MELDEFVEVTLTQIINGVRKAQEATLEKKDGKIYPENILVNPEIMARADNSPKKNYSTKYGDIAHMIDFDVAVTSSSKKGAKAGVNLKVVDIGFGGDFEGVKNDSVVNRIKFQVPVKYPSTK